MAVKNKIYIPTFISSVDYQPVRTLPHIYFYNGLKDSDDYFIQHYVGNTNDVTSSLQTQFPYFDNYEGLIPTTGSKSLLFFNETAVYGDTPTASLYNEYWNTYVSLLYNPRTRLINCSAIIPLADYFEMELNDIVQWRGNVYHLRAINDYNLKDGTCNLQLLGPIIKDAATTQVFDCTFAFSSSFEQIVPTTTTTSGPTTSTTTLTPTTSTTTAVPTTSTTTLTPTTSTTTLTPTTSTTTAAPTTSTTTLTPTTSTTTLTPTTTAAPTTTTTTIAGSYNVEFLVIAGGGGGGASNGGGGAAGGLRSGSFTVTPSTNYSIFVGAGGALNTNGSDSSVFGTTSTGGGRGGYGVASATRNGANGGSGGGGAGGYLDSGNNLADGNTNGGNGTLGQGNNGGSGSFLTEGAVAGGGGGGASLIGINASTQFFSSTNPPQAYTTASAGDGGSGSLWLDGNRYAGGGGGAASSTPAYATRGLGRDGGGNGANETISVGTAGTANTGGGGGGGISTTWNGGAGGSGIVIIRYPGSQVGTGGTVTSSGGYTYHTFTSSGTFTST